MPPLPLPGLGSLGFSWVGDPPSPFGGSPGPPKSALERSKSHTETPKAPMMAPKVARVILLASIARIPGVMLPPRSSRTSFSLEKPMKNQHFLNLEIHMFCASWTSFWSIWGVFWDHPEVFWSHLGSSWSHFGPSGGHLGLSWGHLELSWGHLGLSWGHPELS